VVCGGFGLGASREQEIEGLRRDVYTSEEILAALDEAGPTRSSSSTSRVVMTHDGWSYDRQR
jgi:hypothetical protein